MDITKKAGFRGLIAIFLLIFLVVSKGVKGQLPGFTLTGNPESANGATWTFQQTINGTIYNLQGILFKPVGTGTYPAVIINHGTGGNVNGYSKTVARKMVQWNYVCIATNLCHSSGVPIGSPGDTSQINLGASNNNYLRAMKCWDILAALGYVDTNCVMAFGHSRGAYLTTGLVASFPDKFSAAGHTAGGVTTQPGYSAPTTTLAALISCPYIIHHGDSDLVVPIAMDTLLNHVLNTTGIAHQFHRYNGYNHGNISQDSLMYARTQQWFSLHGCSNSTTPNPFLGHSGVYFLGSAQIPISTTHYGDPKINGVVVRFRWNDLEPSPGNFNWYFIDGEIAKAVTHNKKISLQPLGKPSWLDSLGAQKYYYLDRNPSSPTFGQIFSDIITWDSIYVNRFRILLQNLALKYANNPYVTYVNAIGVNFSRNLPDTVVIDTVTRTKQAFWSAFNYHADSLGALMNDMIDFYMSLFPNTPLWCSVDYVPFQTLANGQPRNYLASVYCNYGVANYPSRFGLFREDLSACNPNVANISTSSHWYQMQQNPCRTGAQMLWSVQDGPTRMNQCGISPNTKTIVLDSAVNKGLALGMRYLEIYGADITDTILASSILQANSRLMAKGLACNPTQGTAVSGSLTYANVAQSPLNNVRIRLKQNNLVIAEDTTDSLGRFYFGFQNPGTYELEYFTIKPWGGVNATDALQITRHFSSVGVLSGIFLEAADLNLSQSVNATDALICSRRFSNVVFSFSTGDWLWTPTTLQIQAGQSSSNSLLKGITYGDVNASYSPPSQ
jgi:dienelactone hydrolase